MNEIVIKPRSPFNGFINYFYKRTNVFSYFKAEGEKFSDIWGDASTVINYSITCVDAPCQWVSPSDLSKSFIVFTFECPIFLTHYTLKTRTDGSDIFPVSWTVDCSIDGDNWINVDTKVNRGEFKEKGDFYTFKCDNAFMYAKKIRIWCNQTRSSSSTTYYQFHLSRVEFFGEMSIDQCKLPFSVDRRCTCRRTNSKHSLLLIMILQIAS